MKLMILVSFLLVLPMFSSGIVETLHLDNVHHEVKEVVMNRGRIDLEMDYADPHPRNPVPSDPPRAPSVDEVETKETKVNIIEDYGDVSPVPFTPRPMPYVPPPPPPPRRPPPRP